LALGRVLINAVIVGIAKEQEALRSVWTELTGASGNPDWAFSEGKSVGEFFEPGITR